MYINEFVDALICISDLVMAEVVSSFVMGHWAVARQVVDRLVSRCTTNVLLVQNKETNQQSEEVYEKTSYNIFRARGPHP